MNSRNQAPVEDTFERQQRRLNRGRILRRLGGLILLAAAVVALQFTPYRNLPREIVQSGLKFISGFFSGGPSEPDPKYW